MVRVSARQVFPKPRSTQHPTRTMYTHPPASPSTARSISQAMCGGVTSPTLDPATSRHRTGTSATGTPVFAASISNSTSKLHRCVGDASGRCGKANVDEKLSRYHAHVCNTFVAMQQHPPLHLANLTLSRWLPNSSRAAARVNSLNPHWVSRTADPTAILAMRRKPADTRARNGVR